MVVSMLQGTIMNENNTFKVSKVKKKKKKNDCFLPWFPLFFYLVKVFVWINRNKIVFDFWLF